MGLWKALMAGLLVLFAGFNFIYRTGSAGVKISGASVSFQRGHDIQLYRVDEQNAVLVSQADLNATQLAVVRTTSVPMPFSLLCGAHRPDGFTTEYAALTTHAALAGRKVIREPHPIPGERDRVHVAMSAAEVATQLNAMPTCNESCLTFNAAFLILFALALLVLPVLLLRRRKARG
jgi:hypothetical protein